MDPKVKGLGINEAYEPGAKLILTLKRFVFTIDAGGAQTRKAALKKCCTKLNVPYRTLGNPDQTTRLDSLLTALTAFVSMGQGTLPVYLHCLAPPPVMSL